MGGKYEGGKCEGREVCEGRECVRVGEGSV